MAQKLYEKCKDLTILFVEDYLPLQKRLSSILSDYFKKVTTASNGEEGLKAYLDFKDTSGKFYDIVMTDCEMPKFNGMELIKAIKKENDDQIFIVISAHQKPEYLIEFINLGILHFAPKPVGTQNMLAVLNKVSDLFVSDHDAILQVSASLEWNKKKKALLYKGKQLDLAKYDVLLIEVLLENLGYTCTTDNIVNHFYLNNEDIKKDNVRNMIVRLKKKIPDVVIESIYGIGYKLSGSM
ncbi:MAG: response regulator transcription factor [Sulfurospirillaceae bacterium]|nr:response regulator transcription factor [Sulfurospirillaceae bacterium]